MIRTIQPTELSDVHPLARGELLAMQCADPCLRRVFHFVSHQRCPSRHECAQESVDLLRLLRHWDKLTIRSDVLYRVSRDPVTKRKTYQFMMSSMQRE